MKTTLWISATITAALLVGCGGSGESTTDMALQTGYLIDSPVSNVDYDCLADGDMNKTTGSNGEFQCRDMSQVRFRIAEIILGEINELPNDKKVFIQDLVETDRTDMNNKQVIELAQLLQSLDEDKNRTNGIRIPDKIKEALKDFQGTFGKDYTQAEDLLDEVKDDHDLDVVTEDEAREHLMESYRDENENENENDQDDSNHNNDQDDDYGNGQGGQGDMNGGNGQGGQDDMNDGDQNSDGDHGQDDSNHNNDQDDDYGNGQGGQDDMNGGNGQGGQGNMNGSNGQGGQG